MSTHRTNLTDELLKDALSSRAGGARGPADLLDDVLRIVQSTSQGQAWGLPIAPVGRSLVLLAASALLLSAMVGLALGPGAGFRIATPAVPIATPFTPSDDGDIVSDPQLRGDPATVIAQYAELHVGWVYLYEDGRVVYHPDGPTYERRLTQAGVDLVRSGAVPVSAILKDPGQLPTRAWADAGARLYEPAKYAICYYLFRQEAMGPEMGPEVDASEALERLPAPAQALLRGRERVFHPGMVEVVVPWLTSPAPPESRECWEVTADEGRVLFGILAAAGWSGDPNAHEPVFGEPSPADGSFDLAIDSELVLPHGVIQGWGG